MSSELLKGSDSMKRFEEQVIDNKAENIVKIIESIPKLTEQQVLFLRGMVTGFQITKQ